MQVLRQYTESGHSLKVSRNPSSIYELNFHGGVENVQRCGLELLTARGTYNNPSYGRDAVYAV